MHELAVTQSVVDAVMERTGEQRVLEVRLRVGRLSGVLPDALRFCFELVTDGTPLQGAVLDIEEPPGSAACRRCGTTFVLTDLILLCPCGSADVEVVGGDELLIRAVELAEEVA
jgi:hydrogenase nickel incorporation protein HypA/HybF